MRSIVTSIFLYASESLTLTAKGTVGHLRHPFLFCRQTVMDQAERMNDLTIFSGAFVTSDVKATGQRLLSCFGVYFFPGQGYSEHFPERRYRILVHGGLGEVPKDANERISTKLQSSAISTIRSRKFIFINPFQKYVHKVLLNYNVTFRLR